MNQTQKKETIGDKLYLWFTIARVPLMAAPVVLTILYLHEIRFFWYGIPVIVLGELVQMWATSHLHKDQKLTISGPYSYIRNPMYFGRFFVGLGFFIMTGSIYVIGAYILAYIIYQFTRVSREEERLRELFGEPYIHYCSEINRFLPKLKPYSKSENRRASWKQVKVNHEHIVALTIALTCLVIYLRITTIHAYWPN